MVNCLRVVLKYSLATIVFCFSCSMDWKDSKIEQPPIERLIDGNKRYVNSDLTHPHQSRARLKEISDAQNPFAVVVSCSDSRVPPEIIFDQGLGDLFVIRTAGNVIGDYELASIEYAILKLKCEVVMVMGHEKCGAIQSLVGNGNKSLPGHLNSLKEFIQSEPNSELVMRDSADNSYHAVIHNIIYGSQFLKKESDIIRAKFETGELEIFGAIYDLDDGRVQIIEDELKKK
jgi:carbonic anhydrase